MTDSATPHSAEPIESSSLPDSGNGGGLTIPAAGATPEDRFLTLIEKIALSPDADVSKLSQLREIRSQWRADEAREAFAADFVAMKPHLPRVIKKHVNEYIDTARGKAKYAKDEDVNEAVDPILAQFGFGTSDKVIAQTPDLITMRIELWHRAGHVEFMDLSMPPDDKGSAGKTNKTLPHAISSTMTYLKRVGKCAILNISTGDDVDGNLPDATMTEERADEIIVLMKEAKPKLRFLNYMKWPAPSEEETIEMIVRDAPAKDYRKAKTALEEIITKKERPV